MSSTERDQTAIPEFIFVIDLPSPPSYESSSEDEPSTCVSASLYAGSIDEEQIQPLQRIVKTHQHLSAVREALGASSIGNLLESPPPAETLSHYRTCGSSLKSKRQRVEYAGAWFRRGALALIMVLLVCACVSHPTTKTMLRRRQKTPTTFERLHQKKRRVPATIEGFLRGKRRRRGRKSLLFGRLLSKDRHE